MVTNNRTLTLKGYILVFLGYFTMNFGVFALVMMLYKLFIFSESTTEVELLQMGSLVGVITSGVTFVIFIIAFSSILKEELLLVVKNNYFVLSITAFLSIYFLNIILSFVYLSLGIESVSLNQEIIIKIFSINKFNVFLMAVVFAPIVEEFVFRKGILELFSKWGDKFGIVVSSLAFGMLHVLDSQSFIFLPIYFLLGIVFGVLYIKTNRNVVATIMTHMINNFIAVIVVLLV